MMYFDHNATTPLLPEVAEAMKPYWEGDFGNPSSIHSAGRRARIAIDKAREKIARCLDADPAEIIFTGGATEANNIALQGTAHLAKRGHLISTAVEHPSVLGPLRKLEQEGFGLTIVGVNALGKILREDLENAVRPDTVLLSIQSANNEVGTIQDVEGIGAWAKQKGLVVHTDAAQAVGKIPVSVKRFPVDLMAFSAHKFYGPKGVGGLFIRKGVRLAGLLAGGAHEKKLRPGTENVAGIVGMAAALEIACRDMEAENQRLQELKTLLMQKINASIENVEFNGDSGSGHQLPNTLNVCIHEADAQSVLMSLDLEGICVSTGAACSSGSLEPSPVLIAMKGSKALAKSSLRISLGRSNIQEDVASLAQSLARVVEQVRSAVLRER